MTTILDRFRLDNQVAIVTGGSKGLGASMALALAAAVAGAPSQRGWAQIPGERRSSCSIL